MHIDDERIKKQKNKKSRHKKPKKTRVLSATTTKKEEDSVWEAMLEQVLHAIVVIRVNYVKPYDGEQAGSAHATGFVVDAERGIILTNRHVIGLGPIRAEAIFINKEEASLTPLYRDPVHDFGFFHYDPNKLKYTADKVRAVVLAPEAAKVGLEIRVVGNDSGEKVSILSGTLARLDRNAPFYNNEGYNDFNTFYYCAASNTSGGSSGSPVLDCYGRAVALNAGGATHSSASYYLPLKGVKRALEALRESRQPVRTTAQIIWRHMTCDEMRRLGLSEETERRLRQAKRKSDISCGLLVVEQLLPQGGWCKSESPEQTKKQQRLDVGDALLQLGDTEFPDFDDLEATLDQYDLSENSEKKIFTVSCTIERGGKTINMDKLILHNLHALNPDEFIEFGGGILHPLSFCATRNGNLDDRTGVYVAYAGFVLDAAGVPCHSVLTTLGEFSTPDLDALESAISKFNDGDRIVARFYNIGDRFNDQVATLRINLRWFPPRRWKRQDPSLTDLMHNTNTQSGCCCCWTSRSLSFFTQSVKKLPSNSISLPNGVVVALGNKNNTSHRQKNKNTGQDKTLPISSIVPPESPASATFQRTCGEPAANAIVSSLCKVSFDVLHAIDGVVDWHFAGTGVVVDAKRGLVAVDRNTVVTSLGEATVTFAASVEIPAKIVFAHPTHNFALVQYDPSTFSLSSSPNGSKVNTSLSNNTKKKEQSSITLPTTRKREVPTGAKLESRELEVGDELTFVGLSRTNSDQPLSQRVRVTEISAVNIAQAHVPRFRAINEEIAKFDQVLNKSLGGVLVDTNSGNVVATWSCYSFYSWNDEKNYESFHAVGVDALADVVNRLAKFDQERSANGDDLVMQTAGSRTNGSSSPLYASFHHQEKLKPLLYSIGFGLRRLPLSTARTSMKLDEHWVDRLQAKQPRRSQVLSVAQLNHASSPGRDSNLGDERVREGDLILAVDGHTCCTFGDVETYVRDSESVALTVWRDGVAKDLILNTEPIFPGPGTDRVILWCGLLLQAPHRAVIEMGAPSTGIYASYYLYGSPASFYTIKACRFIREVNGQQVHDLDDFVQAVKNLSDGESVRLKTSDLQGQQGASTLKTDFAFWPSQQFIFSDGDWHLRAL
mmetsp:Transcript_18302/g.27589  ORF Transcript_18302/g.27589 Transcript_18302/m.27589 type:complete len:1118 (-) Transcript_18302:268-3621(-)